eukprot:scaffold3237_cov179-Ochromonas_danica.AAC.5
MDQLFRLLLCLLVLVGGHCWSQSHTGSGQTPNTTACCLLLCGEKLIFQGEETFHHAKGEKKINN